MINATKKPFVRYCATTGYEPKSDSGINNATETTTTTSVSAHAHFFLYLVILSTSSDKTSSVASPRRCMTTIGDITAVSSIATIALLLFSLPIPMFILNAGNLYDPEDVRAVWMVMFVLWMAHCCY